MHRLTPVILIAAASVALMAQSDQMPKRKPGLWVSTLSMDMPNAPTGSTKVCVDAATDAVLSGYGPGASTPVCKTTILKSDATSITKDVVCTLRGAEATTTQTTHSTTVFTGDSAYHSDSKIHYAPPVMGRSDVTAAADAKWTGPCPADMQPGDLIFPNGRKVNLLQATTGK